VLKLPELQFFWLFCFAETETMQVFVSTSLHGGKSAEKKSGADDEPVELTKLQSPR